MTEAVYLAWTQQYGRRKEVETETAPTLETILDTRVKDMLSSCTEPKDLIQAVKAATAYLAVKNKLNDQEGFGAGFNE